LGGGERRDIAAGGKGGKLPPPLVRRSGSAGSGNWKTGLVTYLNSPGGEGVRGCGEPSLITPLFIDNPMEIYEEQTQKTRVSCFSKKGRKKKEKKGYDVQAVWHTNRGKKLPLLVGQKYEKGTRTKKNIVPEIGRSAVGTRWGGRGGMSKKKGGAKVGGGRPQFGEKKGTCPFKTGWPNTPDRINSP